MYCLNSSTFCTSLTVVDVLKGNYIIHLLVSLGKHFHDLTCFILKAPSELE